MSDLFIFGFDTVPIDISSATVTLGPSLTYNGTEQTQTVTVAVDGVTLTEDTDYTVTDNTGTNAGNYTLAIVGQGAYSGAKSVSWSIAKATGSVSASPTSVSLTSNQLSDTITVTRTGDGAITAQSSNNNVATVSVSETVITVTAVASGSAIITINVAAGTNYNATNTSVNVSVSLVSTTLSENGPATIQEVAQAGTGSTYWSVGARTAAISIGAVGNMSATSSCAFIIGFNHNSSVEGTGIHFQFGKTTSGTDIAFCDSGYNSSKSSGTWFNMNNSATNSGGWSGSRMYTTVCPAFKAALPSAWQSAIKGCKKWTNNTGNSTASSAVTETTDDIFLLAEKEVFGSISYANSNEGNKQVQYTYYANGNSKVKYKHNATSTACSWWLRSAYANGSYYFVSVSTGGGVNGSVANYSFGFAPGFMVG